MKRVLIIIFILLPLTYLLLSASYSSYTYIQSKRQIRNTKASNQHDLSVIRKSTPDTLLFERSSDHCRWNAPIFVPALPLYDCYNVSSLIIGTNDEVEDIISSLDKLMGASGLHREPREFRSLSSEFTDVSHFVSNKENLGNNIYHCGCWLRYSKFSGDSITVEIDKIHPYDIEFGIANILNAISKSVKNYKHIYHIELAEGTY